MAKRKRLRDAIPTQMERHLRRQSRRTDLNSEQRAAIKLALMDPTIRDKLADRLQDDGHGDIKGLADGTLGDGHILKLLWEHREQILAVLTLLLQLAI